MPKLLKGWFSEAFLKMLQLLLRLSMFRKKHPLMFSIITPAFLGRFLYFLYLQSWLYHNCVTLHATKVYFIELLLNIKYIEFWIEFEDKIFIKNLWKCKRVSARRLTKILYKKNKKRWTLDGFLRKLQTTGSIECTPGSGRPVVSKCDVFTLGSVETQYRLVL